MASSVKIKKKMSSGHANTGIFAERVKTAADAASFIDQAGFCILFPVKNVVLPSLYYAVSHRRDARWDKYAQLIWNWKDQLPKKRRAFNSPASSAGPKHRLPPPSLCSILPLPHPHP